MGRWLERAGEEGGGTSFMVTVVGTVTFKTHYIPNEDHMMAFCQVNANM